jgi:hypothetical protein
MRPGNARQNVCDAGHGFGFGIPIETDDFLEEAVVGVGFVGTGRVRAILIFIGMDDEDLVGAIAEIGVEGKAHDAALGALDNVGNVELMDDFDLAGFGRHADQALADTLGDPELVVGTDIDIVGGAKPFNQNGLFKGKFCFDNVLRGLLGERTARTQRRSRYDSGNAGGQMELTRQHLTLRYLGSLREEHDARVRRGEPCCCSACKSVWNPTGQQNLVRNGMRRTRMKLHRMFIENEQTKRIDVDFRSFR